MLPRYGRKPCPLTVSFSVPATGGVPASTALPAASVTPRSRAPPASRAHTSRPGTGAKPAFTLTAIVPAPSGSVAGAVTVSVCGTPCHMSTAGSPIRLFHTDQISALSGSPA